MPANGKPARIQQQKKAGCPFLRNILLLIAINGGERVGFSQPPAELNFTLQGSLFQDVIL